MSIDQIIAAAQVLATIGGAAGAIAALRKRQEEQAAHNRLQDERLDGHEHRLDGHDATLLEIVRNPEARGTAQ